ncbi:MAG: 16S rRNA (cytosine(1402)-N(4))-methyltransferase RsmH [Gemmatimonadota bacterium]|nr:16S rRNA (cytosine(1402)-N(4))-methyltransferase RsmH [Gemmatimonadota bacterium]
MDAIRYHEPVMVGEVLGFLSPAGEGFYLDGTAGGGGHTRAILDACPGCRVLAVDRDPEALDECRTALAAHRDRVRFLRRRFDKAVDDPEVRTRGLEGALLDLGVSSHQLDDERRGFAFRRGVVLDMRMGGEDEGASAAEFLREAPEEDLTRAFREWGEEPRGRRLAREVVRRREDRSFDDADDLVGALAAVLGRAPTAQEKARVFQGVRIAVNREMEALELALPAIRDALNEGGVLVVIAYHSLEDRIVKHAFREWSLSCVCAPGMPVCTCRGRPLGETLTRKPVRPSDDEVSANPRARSARLRAWRRAA